MQPTLAVIILTSRAATTNWLESGCWKPAAVPSHFISRCGESDARAGDLRVVCLIQDLTGLDDFLVDMVRTVRCTGTAAQLASTVLCVASR